MENYQLYRTNVLLGGQMQYDLILNHEDITDFHISPISDKVAYNHHIVDNLLNNSHQENIKEFYKKCRRNINCGCSLFCGSNDLQKR